MDLRQLQDMIEPYYGFLTKEYPSWIEWNFSLWEEFEVIANTMYAKGRTHYSADAIVQILRFHSDIAQVETDETELEHFKLSAKYTADLARTYAIKYPERATFFRYRRPGWQDFLQALRDANDFREAA